MPFDSSEVLTRLGQRFDPGQFRIEFPPLPHTPYRWSPVDYLMTDPEWRSRRWIQEALLCYCSYATDASQLAPFASLLRASSYGLKKYLSPVIPNYAWFKWPQVTYIAFSGTTNWFQWISSVIGMIQVAAAVPIPGQVGNYWKGAADVIRPDVETLLHATSPNSWFVLAGHSMGGAVAEVIGRYMFAFNRWAARRIVTFGAPRVGDRSWGLNGYPPIYRCVNEGDPVTQLPVAQGVVVSAALGIPGLLTGVANFEHSKSYRLQVMTDGRLSSTGSDRAGADGVASAAWSKLVGDFYPGPHALKEYIGRLEYDAGITSAREPFLSALDGLVRTLRSAIGD